MIFQFARLMREASRALPSLDDDTRDAPPEAFVAKVSDEGGDVFLSPVLESLREALRKHRQPSSDAPEARTPVDAAGEAR